MSCQNPTWRGTYVYKSAPVDYFSRKILLSRASTLTLPKITQLLPILNAIMSDPRKFPDNTDHVKGQGILFVRSRVAESAKSKLASDTYTGWYDDEHIRDVLQTSGFTAAFRCSDTRSPTAYASSSNPKPVLAYYPFEDVAFTLSDEFKTIPISSPTLPGPSCFDVADFDICCLALDSKTERKSGVAGKLLHSRLY